MVVAWGQMHLREELQVEDVPAWQTLSRDQRKELMSEVCMWRFVVYRILRAVVLI
jgi:hypothetical protein